MYIGMTVSVYIRISASGMIWGALGLGKCHENVSSSSKCALKKNKKPTFERNMVFDPDRIYQLTTYDVIYYLSTIKDGIRVQNAQLVGKT